MEIHASPRASPRTRALSARQRHGSVSPAYAAHTRSKELNPVFLLTVTTALKPLMSQVGLQ